MTALGLGSEPLVRELFALASQAPQSRVTAAMVKEAVQLAGLKYTEAEQQGMVASLNRILTRAEELHVAPPDNDAPTPLAVQSARAGLSRGGAVACAQTRGRAKTIASSQP